MLPKLCVAGDLSYSSRQTVPHMIMVDVVECLCEVDTTARSDWPLSIQHHASDAACLSRHRSSTVVSVLHTGDHQDYLPLFVVSNCRQMALKPNRQLLMGSAFNFHQVASSGGSIAEWLACWTQAQKGLGSNRSRDAVG